MRSRSQAIDGDPASRQCQTMETAKVGDGKGRGWALDRLCEMDGARRVYDSDELGAIRRDVMTILTHHAASRQAAMAPYGRLLLAGAG